MGAGTRGPAGDVREETSGVEALGHISVAARRVRSHVRRYLRCVGAAVAPTREMSVACVMAAAVFAFGHLAALAAIPFLLAIVVGLGQMDRPFYITDRISMAQVRQPRSRYRGTCAHAARPRSGARVGRLGLWTGLRCAECN